MAELIENSQIFWTNFEPKVSNRFVLYVDGIPSFMVKACDRPKCSAAVITIDHINLQRKIKGKVTWENISLTLYDPVTPSAGQAAMEWFRLSHEAVTGRDGYSEFYKKDLKLQVLGPVGDVVEEWQIKGAFIAGFTPSGMDASGNDVATVQLDIAMDYCILRF